MDSQFQVPATARPGICDFVPAEDPFYSFAARYHPRTNRLLLVLKNAGLESLLEAHRLLALTELTLYSAKRSNGDVIELGVYKGGSAAAASWSLHAAGLERPLHLCDTFEGMPQTLDWEFHKRNDFADTSYETVALRLRRFLPDFPFRLHRGLFSHTLSGLRDCRFCFAHVDADVYESVRQACEFLYPRMAKGGIILFDDYGAPTCPGAKKAIDEFFKDKLEKPTHVSITTYGVTVGCADTDFHRLLVRRTLIPAVGRAAYRAPDWVIRRALSLLSRRRTSPKFARLITGPLIRFARRTRDSNISARDARRILVLRPDAIGDLVLMSPFLRELRGSNATCWITLLVDPRFSNLVELCPYVNEVLAFNGASPGAMTRLRILGRALSFASRSLWRRHFDLALCPRWDVDNYHSAYVCRVSGAVHRVGYSENVSSHKQKLNRGLDRKFTYTLDDRTPMHEVERNLNFLRSVGGTVTSDGLELWLSEEDRNVAREAFSSKGLGGGEFVIAVAPGARHAKRQWPLERFVQLGCQLTHELGAKILVVGGEEDKERAQELAEALGDEGFSFAGATIRQTAAMLELAKLAISNDSGPMHLAAAAGVPVVEISCHPANGDPSHANSPVRFRPWVKEHIVIQPAAPREPCGAACEWHEAHCILGVSIAAVERAVQQLLDRIVAKKASSAGAVSRPEALQNREADLGSSKLL